MFTLQLYTLLSSNEDESVVTSKKKEVGAAKSRSKLTTAAQKNEGDEATLEM